jgi:uncharacterized membrane protein YvlD (DUF360 family)
MSLLQIFVAWPVWQEEHMPLTSSYFACIWSCNAVIKPIGQHITKPIQIITYAIVILIVKQAFLALPKNVHTHALKFLFRSKANIKF